MKNKKSNFNKAFILPLLIILVAVFMVGVIYWYKANSSNSSPTVVVAPQTSQPQIVATSTEEYQPVRESAHVTAEKTVIKGVDPSEYIGDFTKDIILPKIKNLPLQIAAEINKIFTIEKLTYGETFEDIKKEANGTTGIDYEVKYDKNDVLSLSIYLEGVGAYPSSRTENHSFDLKTGKDIRLVDIFHPNKIDSLMQMLNVKLASSIKDAIDYAKADNPTNESGQCSEETIRSQLQDNEFYHKRPAQFSPEDLDFIITTEGIEFFYNFGFPHVILACEPSQIGIIKYAELKSFMNPNGLLGSEIR